MKITISPTFSKVGDKSVFYQHVKGDITIYSCPYSHLKEISKDLDEIKIDMSFIIKNKIQGSNYPTRRNCREFSLKEYGLKLSKYTGLTYNGDKTLSRRGD